MLSKAVPLLLLCVTSLPLGQGATTFLRRGTVIPLNRREHQMEHTVGSTIHFADDDSSENGGNTKEANSDQHYQPYVRELDSLREYPRRRRPLPTSLEIGESYGGPIEWAESTKQEWSVVGGFGRGATDENDSFRLRSGMCGNKPNPLTSQIFFSASN